jgi:hypothetical protein
MPLGSLTPTTGAVLSGELNNFAGATCCSRLICCCKDPASGAAKAKFTLKPYEIRRIDNLIRNYEPALTEL